MIINGKHLWGALMYSLAGLRRAWRGEQAFRHEILLLPVAVFLLVALRPGVIWSAVLSAGWLFVIALELINSAVEEVFDLVSPEANIHAKHGKDMASAAVFVAVCANGLLWLFMLWDVYCRSAE